MSICSGSNAGTVKPSPILPLANRGWRLVTDFIIHLPKSGSFREQSWTVGASLSKIKFLNKSIALCLIVSDTYGVFHYYFPMTPRQFQL